MRRASNQVCQGTMMMMISWQEMVALWTVKGRLWYIPCEGSTGRIPSQAPEHKNIIGNKMGGIRRCIDAWPWSHQDYRNMVRPLLVWKVALDGYRHSRKDRLEVRRRGCCLCKGAAWTLWTFCLLIGDEPFETLWLRIRGQPADL